MTANRAGYIILAMSPAILPPVTLEDALRVDLQWGQIVYSPGMSARVDGIFVGCPSAKHEQHRPHGGEPDLRVVRGTSATTLNVDSSGSNTSTSITFSSAAASGVRVFIVHQPLVPTPEWQLIKTQGNELFAHPAFSWRKDRDCDRVTHPAVPAPHSFRAAPWLPRRA